MKKLLIPLLITGFLSGSVLAATDAGNRKYWNNERITWADITNTQSLKGIPSALKTGMEISTKPEKKGNIKIIRPRSFAYIDLDQSWADSAARTPEQLRYYQALFDLMEVYNRKFQKELNRGMSALEAESYARHFLQTYNEQAEQMKLETAQGLNEKKMDEWELYIVKELIQTQNQEVSAFYPRKFGYGLNLGFGTVIPTGKLSDYFTPAWQFKLGFDLAYQRAHLLVDLSAGTCKNKSDIRLGSKGIDYTWGRHKHTNFSQIAVSIGYDAFNNDRFKLTPFAGACWSEYSKQMEIAGNDRFILSRNRCSVIGGIEFDYKFMSVVSLVPSFWFGHREMYTSALRTRFFVSYGKYDFKDPVSGCLIGISVSYSGFGRMIGVRK